MIRTLTRKLLNLQCGDPVRMAACWCPIIKNYSFGTIADQAEKGKKWPFVENKFKDISIASKQAEQEFLKDLLLEVHNGSISPQIITENEFIDLCETYPEIHLDFLLLRLRFILSDIFKYKMGKHTTEAQFISQLKVNFQDVTKTFQECSHIFSHISNQKNKTRGAFSLYRLYSFFVVFYKYPATQIDSDLRAVAGCVKIAFSALEDYMQNLSKEESVRTEALLRVPDAATSLYFIEKGFTALLSKTLPADQLELLRSNLQTRASKCKELYSQMQKLKLAEQSVYQFQLLSALHEESATDPQFILTVEHLPSIFATYDSL